MLNAETISAIYSPHDQSALQRHCDATDTLFDRLVYDLYGITDDGISIIEPSTAPNKSKS